MDNLIYLINELIALYHKIIQAQKISYKWHIIIPIIKRDDVKKLEIPTYNPTYFNIERITRKNWSTVDGIFIRQITGKSIKYDKPAFLCLTAVYLKHF